MKVQVKNVLNKLIFIGLSMALTACSVTSQHTVKGSKVVHDSTKPIIFNESTPRVEFNDESIILIPNIFSEHEVTRTDRLVTTVMEKEVPVVAHVAAGLSSVLFLGIPQVIMIFNPDYSIYKCDRNRIKCRSTSTSENKVVEFPLKRMDENEKFYGAFEVISDNVRFFTELNKNGVIQINKEQLAGATEFALNITTQDDDVSFYFSLPALYTGHTTLVKTQENKVLYHSFAWYQKAVRHGNIFAVYKLALHYEEGIGTKKDIDKAIELYKQASENGVREAQFKLGQLYFNGNSIIQSDSKAVILYEKAIEKGDANAQNALGELYYKGREVNQNKKKSLNLYLAAAKQGMPIAQFNLSVFYYDFSGSDNLIKSYQWGVIAQKNGFDAKKALKVIKSEMSNTDINKANKYIKKCLASHYRDCL